ncbi:unnamed protein product [marine sediment metagenome]|uniref:Uncharacterized protein n=1 Tax=marine sediment metagenome TaxID=412755 RepID=X1KGQ2_9ZZZZ
MHPVDVVHPEGSEFVIQDFHDPISKKPSKEERFRPFLFEGNDAVPTP